MNVLMIAVNDPAGTAIQFCKAVNRSGRHVCRLVTLETRYTHAWEKDLHVPDLIGPDGDESGLAELERLLKTSDVFHFHMTADEHLRLGPFSPADHLAGKGVVHHEHGHHEFRGDPERFRRKYRELGRRHLLVSTPDLKALMPEAAWQPNLVPQHEELFLPQERAPQDWEGPFRLAHSPTRKDLKNTDDLLAVAQGFAASELELDLIDNVPNAECLARKRACHALFDHMQGYYGVSSLEGLSQGIPVIAGLNEWNRRHVCDFSGAAECDLPWVLAHDRATLDAALRRLMGDRALCRDIGQASRRFVEQRWSEAKVAARLMDFWERM